MVLLIIYIWVFAPFKDDIKVRGLIKGSKYFERIGDFMEI
jgi:hypothetical protein